MADPLEVWEHPLFHDPATTDGPPLTDALIAQAEARLGLRLPAAYTASLRTCNGGELRRVWVELPRRTAWGATGIAVRDLLGLGGPSGTDGEAGTALLTEEWDLPSPGVVLSSEGPQAILLDYRRRGPGAEPTVIFADSDHATGADTTWCEIAPDMATFLAALRYRAARTELALPGRWRLEEVVAACERAGAEGPARADFTGRHSLSLVGGTTTEPGPALLVIRANKRPEVGALAFPELGHCQWILESNLCTAEVPGLLSRLAATLPARAILLHAS